MSVLASHAPGDVDVQPTVRPINASDNLACSIAGFPNPRTAHLSLTSPISDHTLPLGSCHHLQGLSRPRVSRCLHQPYATLITYKAARFLITDQPSDSNIEHFIRECRLHRVHKLVRVCEPEYDKSRLEAAGIEVVDLEYGDGSSPPEDIIERWFYLILDGFQHNPHSCIAVHCKSGLGRAPALVAVALIEMGLPYDEAIETIRERRRGAFNARQIQFLKNYRPRRRLRNLKNSPSEKCSLL